MQSNSDLIGSIIDICFQANRYSQTLLEVAEQNPLSAIEVRGETDAVIHEQNRLHGLAIIEHADFDSISAFTTNAFLQSQATIQTQLRQMHNFDVVSRKHINVEIFSQLALNAPLSSPFEFDFTKKSPWKVLVKHANSVQRQYSNEITNRLATLPKNDSKIKVLKQCAKYLSTTLRNYRRVLRFYDNHLRFLHSSYWHIRYTLYHLLLLQKPFKKFQEQQRKSFDSNSIAQVDTQEIAQISITFFYDQLSQKIQQTEKDLRYFLLAEETFGRTYRELLVAAYDDGFDDKMLAYYKEANALPGYVRKALKVSYKSVNAALEVELPGILAESLALPLYDDPFQMLMDFYRIRVSIKNVANSIRRDKEFFDPSILTEESLSTPDSRNDIETWITRESASNELQTILRKLTQREQEVMLLRANDLSQKTIARILDISPETVNTHLDRARKRARGEMPPSRRSRKEVGLPQREK